MSRYESYIVLALRLFHAKRGMLLAPKTVTIPLYFCQSIHSCASTVYEYATAKVREYLYQCSGTQVLKGLYVFPMATKFTYKRRLGGKRVLGSGTHPSKTKSKKNFLTNGKMLKTYKNTFLEAVQAHVHACHPHTWCWAPRGGDSQQRSWCAPALGKIGLKRKVLREDKTVIPIFF